MIRSKTTMSVAWKAFKSILALVCIWYAANFLHYLYRNHQGYCSATQIRLSDTDKIDRAIEHLLIHYPSDERRLKGFLKAIGVPASELSSARTPIAYTGLPDFKRHNQNCCEVQSRPNDVDAPPVTLFDRLSGGVSSFVDIKFKLRYRDEFGAEQQQLDTTYYAISNCGVAWND